MFFLFFCIISVNGLYAQFYTVKKKIASDKIVFIG